MERIAVRKAEAIESQLATPDPVDGFPLGVVKRPAGVAERALDERGELVKLDPLGVQADRVPDVFGGGVDGSRCWKATITGSSLSREPRDDCAVPAS